MQTDDPKEFTISIVVSEYELRNLASQAGQDHDGGQVGAVADVALLCPALAGMQLVLPPITPSYLTGANMVSILTEVKATLMKLTAQQLTAAQQEAAGYLAACLALLEARLHRYLLKDTQMAAALYAEGEAARRLSALYERRGFVR